MNQVMLDMRLLREIEGCSASSFVFKSEKMNLETLATPRYYRTQKSLTTPREFGFF